MKLLTNILVIALVINFVSCVEEFPSNIQRCKPEDDECLVNAWNKYMQIVETVGIPELGVPHSDKTFVEKQVVQVGSKTSPLNLKITFRNVNVTGMATCKFEKVTGFKRDPKTMSHFTLKGFVPFVSIKGRYEASGKLLLLQLTGSGNGEIEYHNITFTITVYTKTEIIDGEEYLVISKVHTDYESERNKFAFDNILNNKEVTESVNKIVNENQDVIREEVNRPTSTSFARIFKEILVPIFKRYPYKRFFLD